MKKWYVPLCFLFCGVAASAGAQNVKIKNNTVFVDGKEYVNIVQDGPNKFALVSIESDSELVYMKLVDPTPGNSDFNDNYFTLSFPDYDREMDYKNSQKTAVIKFLYNNRIIRDGRINKGTFPSFINRYGKEPEK